MKKTLLVILAGVVFFVFTAGKPRYETAKPEGGKVMVPLKILKDGIPHYYKITIGGKEVRFFLLMSNDGVVRAAFDACDVCYPFKKGYSYNGDYVICNNCGRAFHETKINVLQGGCNPAPIERSFDKEFISLSLENLSRGTFYF